MNDTHTPHYFLRGGGEMGELIRTNDWSKTPLGDPKDWPESLKTMVSVMLNTPIGMCIVWGKECIQLYNDAFTPILPSSKHTDILGNSAKESFAKIWHNIQSTLEGEMDEVHHEDNEDINITPIYIEHGHIGGVLLTPQVIARKKVEESEERYHRLIHSSPSAIGILSGEDLVITIGNDPIFEIWGKGRSITGMPYFEALPELAEQGYREVFGEVYRTGIPFNAVETPVHIEQNGEMTLKYYNFLLYPQRDADGAVNGIGIIATEVTSQALLNNKIKKSEQSIRALVESAPFPIAVYTGKEMRIEFANQSIIDVWGKGDDVVGQLYTDILPELEGQAIFEQVQQVYSTGIAFHAKNQRVDLEIDGVLKPYYFNYSFTPLFDADGQVYGVMNTAAEITELNEAKRKVEESEKRFKDSVMQAPLGIAIFSGPDFVTELANENYLLLVDKTEKELIGKPLFQVVPEVKRLVAPLFAGVIKTGKQFHSPELPATLKRHGQMQHCYFNLVYHPLKEETGEIKSIMVVATEVTETVKAKHLLEESEKHFRNMVMQSPIPMTILRGENFIIDSGNKVMFETIWNKKQEDIVGKSLLDVFPELKGQKYPELLKGVYHTGISHTEKESVALIQGDDGLHKFYLDFEYAPLYDTDGVVTGIMITINDVTDKVEARQKVEEAEERSRLAAEATDLATWELDLETRILYHTPRLAEIYGHPLTKQMTHPEARERLIEEDRVSIVEKAFEEALVSGIYLYEARIQRLDGDIRWIRLQGKTILNEDKEPYKLVGTLRDVTEEKLLHQSLLEREQKFRLLADSMPQHIWTADPLGQLNYFNQSVYDYSGMSPVQVHENWLQIVHPDDREENIEKWMNAVSTGQDFLLEHRFRRYDGTYRWQLSRAIPQKDEEGKITMWVGTSTDIQDQKMFTNELERQVSERTKELNEKNVVLEKMNQELQSFAYISSHDLQEPLRKIQTFATQIMDREFENLTNSGQDKFQRMQNAANRMQTLIQDLLVYSRAGIEEQNFEVANLETILKEIEDDLQEELLQKNATIEYGDMCELKMIPFQFRQIIVNLISNALKFSKEDTPPNIYINCEIKRGDLLNNENLIKKKKYCHILFADNGIGFEPEYSNKIFEVFQRLHGKDTYNGTGIGLAIVKRIVENHQGFITASGELGKGAQFDIYIPAL